MTPRSSTVEFRFSSDSFERSGNAAAQERAESAPARPTTIEPDGKARTVGTTPGAPAASSGTSRAPQANEPRGPVRIAASDGQDTILKTEAPTSRQVRPESPSPVPPTPPRPEVPSGTFGRRSTDSAGDPAKDPIARPVESNAGANSARAGDSTNATDSALHRATVATPPPAVPVVARPVDSLTSGPGAEPSAHDSHGGEASDSATAESEQTDSLSAPTSRAPRATLSGAQSRAAETDDTSPAHFRAAGTAVASVGPETAKETAPTQPSAGPAGPSSTTPLVLRAVPGLEMQLAVRARELLTKGRTEIRIRLDPPELGRLRIQLQIEDHRAVARIVTSSPEAAALLARDREDLARAFQHHGFERVDVHIDADSENAAWDRNEGEGPHGRAPSEDAPASGTERSGAPRRAHSPSSSPSSRGVDLFV
ncbi:MAG: flagellar hook-length control protein FliK [Gemmatimonadetes bacterium]|nr:flagellar hook-length control protein FliK [Gemmatimonadota bacterium]